MDLTRTKCVPCEGGIPRVEGAERAAMLWKRACDATAAFLF